MNLRFRAHKLSDSLDRKALRQSPRVKAAHAGLYPASLRPSGNTPKLTRRLPLVDTEPPVSKSPGELPAEDSISETTPRVERKLKRSESYRMANSPIMFMKKLGSSSSNSSEVSPDKNAQRIFRTASEELREELLKERINYPDSVASPEPEASASDAEEMSPSLNGFRLTRSPRPRPIDIEPTRVLKYSGTDTEIW
jgi:hypothetical protein